jgi:glycine betaine/proline transport system substrate-binding protein
MDHDVFNGVLKTDMEKKQGVLFLCWQPHWIWKAYDLRVVEEPPYTEGCLDGMVYPNEDPDWFEKSKVACGNAPGTVRLAYSASLNKRAPEIVEFLNRVKIDTQTASNWIYDISIGDNRPDASEYAKKWVEENRDVVDKWLGL